VPQFVDSVAVPQLLFTPNGAVLCLLLGALTAVVTVTTLHHCPSRTLKGSGVAPSRIVAGRGHRRMGLPDGWL